MAYYVLRLFAHGPKNMSKARCNIFSYSIFGEGIASGKHVVQNETDQRRLAESSTERVSKLVFYTPSASAVI